MILSKDAPSCQPDSPEFLPSFGATMKGGQADNGGPCNNGKHQTMMWRGAGSAFSHATNPDTVEVGKNTLGPHSPRESSEAGCHTGAVTETTPTVSIGTESQKRLFHTPVQTQQPPSLNVAYTMTASQMTSKTGYAGSTVSPDLGRHNAQYNAVMD